MEQPVSAAGSCFPRTIQAIRGGWYLGGDNFKNKLLGLINKAGAKVMNRGSIAGAAVRAHGEGEAERTRMRAQVG